MSLDGGMGESVCAVHREKRKEGNFSADKAKSESTCAQLQATQSTGVLFLNESELLKELVE